jgi:acyl-[acyl-carrier-protein]-phospholipid O-acyltransferase/long-chain-fatty-acid--[acyl-carrier-protein] ligase
MSSNPPASPAAGVSERSTHMPRTGPDGGHSGLPPLFRDRAFWGMTVTQFLGAFNDNLFKQLMLLLAIPVGGAMAGSLARDQQGLATVVFSLPFIFFSGLAGFLSDRRRKRDIIVASKVAEIAVMALGMLAFLAFPITGYTGLLVVLFLMGTQSAFFGPGKYGILPEMLRESDLPRANGVIVMSTFLAIILGTAVAGVLKDVLSSPTRLAFGSLACIIIAVAGTGSSLLIRAGRAAYPRLPFQLSALTIPPDTRRVLATDRPLTVALLVSCMFWLVSGIAIPAVNSLGRMQLGLSNTLTSLMTASIGLGIAAGAVIAGRISRGKADFRVTRAGSWGIFVCLLLMSLSTPGGVHWLGHYGSLLVLVLLGMFAGFFAIPLQVFIQSRPPEDQKGRMIAVMNLANFTAILISGVLYFVLDRLVDFLQAPRSAVFAAMALLILPVAIWYRPHTDTGPAEPDAD